MTAFARAWLELREPHDAAARATAMIDQHLPSNGNGNRRRIVDLGAGTGANLRYLAPRLGGVQNWLLVEGDPVLLGASLDALGSWARGLAAEVNLDTDAASIATDGFECRARLLQLDLATRFGALELPQGALVTASALLDLVSEQWLVDLASRCRRAGAEVLFALTYDGRIQFEPSERDDAWMRDLVNRHQRGDKGFGPALGPAAGQRAEAIFAAAGYDVVAARSDWTIAPDRRAMQMALLDGWCSAAGEIEPGALEEIDDWRRRREAHVSTGRSCIVVGHSDLAAAPS